MRKHLQEDHDFLYSQLLIFIFQTYARKDETKINHQLFR